MHCSSSEALAQLVRLGREDPSLSSLAPGQHGSPFSRKNEAIQLSLTLLGVWVGAGRGRMEGMLLTPGAALERNGEPGFGFLSRARQGDPLAHLPDSWLCRERPTQSFFQSLSK